MMILLEGQIYYWFFGVGNDFIVFVFFEYYFMFVE